MKKCSCSTPIIPVRRARSRFAAGWGIAALALVCGIFVPTAQAAYDGTGTFELVTSINDIEDGGYYMFQAGTRALFMVAPTAAGVGSTYAPVTTLTPVDNKVTDPNAGYVFRLNAVGSGYTLYNEARSHYYGASSANAFRRATTPVASSYYWLIATTVSSHFQFSRVGMTNRKIVYNTGSPRFAPYNNPATSYLRPRLYKLQVSTTAPEIVVKDGATVLANEATVALGSVTVGQSVTKTITIENSGTAALSITTPLALWYGTERFSITTQPSSSVAANGSTTFVVTFAPTATGTLEDAMEIVNNDADENDFTLYFTGTGVAPAASAPTVTSPTSASVTSSGATLGATVTANGGAALTAAGVQYSTDGSTWTTVAAGSVPAVGTAFTVPVTGLSGNTAYTYRGYAVNSVGTSYSATATFTTPGLSTATWLGNSYIVVNNSWYNGSGSGNPTFSSLGTLTGLTLGGQAQTWGDTTAADHVVALNYSIDQGTQDFEVHNLSWYQFESNNNWFQSGGSTFSPQTIDISGLMAGQYNLRVFFSQVTTGGTIYDSNNGNNFVATFTIAASAPTITEGPKTVGTATASLPITVNMGKGASSGIALVYGVSTSYGSSATVNPSSLAASVTAGDVTGSMSGLQPGTTYYYKWTISNSGGTTEQTGSFTTEATAPTVTSPTSASVAKRSATLGATVTANGGAAISDYGIVYATTQNPTTGTGTKVQKGTSLTTFGTAWTVSASGLTPGTIYYYRGYAVNSAGTGYSAQGTFTTPALPTAPTLTVTTPSSPVALGGTIIRGTGGTSVRVYRFATSAAATTATAPSFTGGTACTVSGNTFSDSGLASCTAYYYRAWEYDGTDYSAGSGVVSGETTSPAAPVLSATNLLSSSSFSFSWGAVPGATNYVVQVATNEDFSAGGGSAYATETFNSATFSGTASQYGDKTITGGVLGTWTATQSRSDSTAVDGTAAITVRYGGVLTSPSLANGVSSMAFDYAFPYSESGTFTVLLSINGTPMWTNTISAASSGTSTFTGFPPVSGAAVITLANQASSNKRMTMDNIVILPASTSGSLVDEGETTGTSYAVTGLTAGTEYYYRVRAVGSSEECQSDWSTTGSATPVAAQVAPEWGTIPSQNTTVVGGVEVTVTGYLATQGNPAPTFSVASTGGNTPAGTYSVVASTGVFTFEPSATDAGKTFVFTFTAANAAGSPTATMTVTVAASTITLAGTLSAFSTLQGTASAAQSFTVSGANLGADITVTAPAGYEVSTAAGSGYASSVTLTHTGGTVSPTTLYIRLAASATAGTYNGNITAASTGATSQTLSVTGRVAVLPVWGSIPAQTVVVGSTLSRTMTGYLATQGNPAPTFSVASTGTDTPTGAFSVNASTGAFTYTPSAADAGKAIVFTFTAANAAGSPTATMSVTVTTPNIELAGSGDFGSVTTGQSTTRTYTINNTGTAALTVSAVTVANTSGNAFSMATTWTSQAIAAGGSATFDVEFAPIAEVTYAATLTIASTDPDTPSLTLNLTGNGASAACEEGSTNTFDNTAANFTTQTIGTAGIYNSSPNVGMWGHGTENGIAAFRKFTTTGLNSGTARPLQIGDEFEIWTFKSTASGYYGVSLNDSTTFNAFSDNYNTRRVAWQLDSDDLYKIYAADTTTSAKDAGQWRRLRIKPTSSSTFTASITDDAGANEDVYCDLTMMNAPSASSRIQSFALYLENDGNSDAMWNSATVNDTGVVEFGSDNGTRTISGTISDGIPANCASGSRSNRVFKAGTGTVTLTADNTFSGGVEIKGGTLAVSKDAALGAVPASAWGAVNIWSSGTLQATDTFAMNALRGIEMGTVNTPRISVDSTKTLTVAGPISGSATWVKNGAGTLALSGNNAFTGGFAVVAGTLRADSIGALGGTGSGQLTMQSGTTLELAASPSVQKLVMNDNSTFSTAAGRTLTVAQASTVDDVLFNVSADASFDGSANAEWTLVTGAAVSTNMTTALTVLNPPEGVGAVHGQFVLVAEGSTLKVKYWRPSASGGNNVYWRVDGGQTSGHWVQANAWWYALENGAGFVNGNMTDFGPNNVYIDNNIQVAMTNNTASTVNSLNFTANANVSHVLWGSALTVNNRISSAGGAIHTIRFPIVAGGETLTVDATGASRLTISGSFSGTARLVKTGSQVLVINGSCSLAGVTVEAGRFLVGLNSAGGSIAGDVLLSSATSDLTFSRSTPYTYGGIISGPGLVQVFYTNTTLTGESTYTGQTTINDRGTLILGHANAVAGSSLVYANGNDRTLQLGAALTTANVKRLQMFTNARLSLARGQTLNLTGTAASTVEDVTFDAQNYSGASATWTIVNCTGTGTVATNPTTVLTVVNPPATGRCELQRSADGKTLSVVYYAPPAAPTLVVVPVTGNGSQMTVTTTAGAGASVVVVRNTSGTFGTPTGTTLPAVGATFAGGTVVVSGAAGTATDSGLTACEIYAYAAWTLQDGLWSTTSAEDLGETDTPAVPTGLAESTPVGAFSATLNWSASAGADGYLLDVSTSTFGSSGGGYVLVKDLADLSEGNYVIVNATDDFAMNNTCSGTSSGYMNKTAVAPSSETIASADSTIVWTLSGNATDGWTLYNAAADKYVNPASGTSMGFADTASGVWRIGIDSDGTAYVTNGTTAYMLQYNSSSPRFTCYSSSQVKLHLYKQAATTEYFNNGSVTFHDYDVGNVTSFALTGLDEETTYYWRLRAQGASADCLSDYSSTDSFTTIYDATRPNVVLSDVDAGQVAAGSMTNGTPAKVLHSTKLVVTTAAAPLTGLTFTTEGTALAADLTNFKLWRSTSATFSTATATLLGTLTTAMGAGTHTFTLGTPASLAVGTHYLYITADVASGAIGGRTVNVAALAAGAYSFTDTRKTGATTAGGVQTIHRAPSISMSGSPATWAAGTSYSESIDPGTGVYPTNLTWTMSIAPAGVDGSPNITGNGTTNAAFMWSPPASEVNNTYTFTITAANDAGSSTCTYVVTVGMGLLQAFDVVPVEGNGGSLLMSWMPCGAGTSVMIRYSDTSLEAITGPNVGGTVAYSGPSSVLSATLTGLTACKTYYFKAWEVTGTTYSAQPLEDSATTVEPGATDQLQATALDYNTFTATWNAVPGAASYRLDVWQQIGEPLVGIQDFETTAATPTLAYANTGGSFGTTATGWYPTDATFGVGGSRGFYGAGTTATVTFGPVDLSMRANGVFSMELSALSGNSNNGPDSGDTVTISVSPDNGVTYYPVLSASGSSNSRWLYGTGTNGVAGYQTTGTPVSDSGVSKLIVTNLPQVANVMVKVVMTCGDNEAWAMDNAKIEADRGVTFLTGYENLSVSGTSQVVNGLTQETEYWFRVRAQGATADCVGPNVTTNVTTLEACPSPETVNASDGTFWDKIQVTWSSRLDRGATGYAIWRSATPDTNDAVQVGTVTGGSVLTWDDTDATLVLGETYWYWVRSTMGGVQSRMLEPDSGYMGAILRRTGFEGDPTAETWTLHAATDADEQTRPEHARHLHADVETGIESNYAFRIAGGQALRLDTTALPAGTTSLALTYRFAADGPDANDNLVLQMSTDGWDTSTDLATVAVGANNLRQAFTVSNIDLSAVSGPLSLGFAHVHGGVGDAGFYYIDDLKLIGNASSPKIGLPATWMAQTAEGAGTLTVPVTISSAAAATVEVVAGGTAIPGTDYTISPATVTFTAGGSTTANVTITLTDDATAEGMESIRLTLKNATGATIGGSSEYVLQVQDNESLSLASANLAPGAEGERVLQMLRPDVTALQAWIPAEGDSYAAFVSRCMGAGFAHAENATDGLGVISRFAISSSGAVTVGATAKAFYAVVDLPNATMTNDLIIVNAQFTAGDTTANVTARSAEATALVMAVQTLINAETLSANDHVAVMGSLNFQSRNEAGLATLTAAGWLDLHKPIDVFDRNGTDLEGTLPLDYILPSEGFDLHFTPYNYATRSYPNGAILDTRDWGYHPFPALACDSSADGMAHRPVAKLFVLGQVVENPTVTVDLESVTATTADWTVAPNSAGDEWVVVWNTTGAFAMPEAGTTIPAVGEAFAGGIIVAKGDGSIPSTTGTQTGLTACQPQAFCGYSKADNGTFSGGAIVFFETEAPAAPTALVASETNSTSFEISWTPSPVGGELWYELDVSLEDLSVATHVDRLKLDAEGTTFGIETFESGVPSWWTSSSVYNEIRIGTGKQIRIGTGSAVGHLTTSSINLSANNGEAKLTFNAAAYDSDEKSMLAQISRDNGTTWTNIYSTTALPEDAFTNCVINLTDCTAATKIKFINSAVGKRFCVDDVRIQQRESAACIPGYEHHPVTENPFVVTGLVESTTYYWRLRAHGGACDSDWVYPEAATVTTLGAPRISTIPQALAFGEVERNVSASLTLVVTNFGHSDLNISGVTFVNAPGSAGAGYFSCSPGTLTGIAPGDTGNLTVTFLPTMGGTFNVLMRIANNTPDANPFIVEVSGECYDPMTTVPSITGFGVTDETNPTNMVFDHAMAFDNDLPVLLVTAYHFMGLKTDAASAQWSLRGTDNAFIFQNQPFTAVSNVTMDGRTYQRFSAVLPNLGAGAALLGQYKIEAKFVSSNNLTLASTGYFTPADSGWLMDDFNRAPASGSSIGGGWLVGVTNALEGEVVVTDAGRLEMYGAHAAEAGAQNGCVEVYQDVSGLPYVATLNENDSTLTWGFMFRSGRSLGNLDANSSAGAFVLGATEPDFILGQASQRGYAVMLWSNRVQLACFATNLCANRNVTVLGSESFSVLNGETVAVRVDYLPERGSVETGDHVDARFRLYARALGTSIDEVADINPSKDLGSADLVETIALTDNRLDTLELGNAGAIWNHGSAAASDTTGIVYDNFYFPHAEGRGVLMNFQVIDEDVVAPVHSDFSTRGAISYGPIPADGLVVTGLVTDASGVWTGTSNIWVLYSNDTQLATGTLTANPAAAGTATAVGLSCTIPKDNFTAGFNNYIFEVVSSDYDIDRPDDSLSVTSRFVFAITDQVLTEPTSFSVAPNGPEMVEAHWEVNNQWVVIVRSPTEIPDDFAPPQGTEVATGGTFEALPGAVVAYVGNGVETLTDNSTANTQAAEINVPAGTTNYFRIFGTANNYFTAGHKPDSTNDWPLANPVYEPGEIVESFAYPVPVIPASVTEDQWKWAKPFTLDPARAPTGNEWFNGWFNVSGDWKIHDANLITGDTGYPEGVGNKLYWNDTYTAAELTTKPATEVSMTRKLKTPRSGTTFVAFQMNFLYPGGGKYINIGLMTGENAETELVSFGRSGTIFVGEQDLNIDQAAIFVGAASGGSGEYAKVPGGSGYVFEGGVGKDYAVVGEWDAEDKALRLYAYATNQPIPQEYTNAVPIATYTNANLALDITGIRIIAGSPANVCNGHVYIDEIRMGSTWDETLLFNKPEVYNYAYGEQYGHDGEQRPLFRVSDGALAHLDVPFDAEFSLYHRTGIADASFAVLDPFNSSAPFLTGEDRLVLNMVREYTDGVSVWSNSPSRLSVAIDTNKIFIGTNYTIEVEVESTGHKINVTTVAAEGGGAAATDLFFGEYGENTAQDNYLEIYNGTGRAIDLADYWIVKFVDMTSEAAILEEFEDPSNWAKANNAARIGAGTIVNAGQEGNFILPHKETVCIVPNSADNSFVNALVNNGRRVIRVAVGAMSVSGNDPQMLMYAPGATTPEAMGELCKDTGWLDMAGMSYPERVSPDPSDPEGQYIMYRLESTPVLPRRYPQVVDWDEWNYRDWLAADKPNQGGSWTNLLATAGLYDSKVGLGGDMYFTVYDDDVDAPVIGNDSELTVGGQVILPTTGATEICLIGWSFTNNTGGTALARLPSGTGLSTDGEIIVDDRYVGDPISIATGTGTPGEFGEVHQVARGELYLAGIGQYFTEGDEPAKIVFRTQLARAATRLLSFDQAGGSAGFASASLQWSTAGDINNNDAWTDVPDWSWDPNTGGASSYANMTFNLEDANIPNAARMLYFRLLLWPGASTTAAGSFRLDNIQVSGFPDEYIVTDGRLLGSTLAFQGNLYDTNSGITATSAALTLGSATMTRSATNLVNDGRGTESTITWNSGNTGLDKAGVTAWFTASHESGLPVELSVSDADDDRPNDQVSMIGNFGDLRIIDDDTVAPRIKMSSMKPVAGGILAQWLYTAKGTVATPTKTDASVIVSELKTQTTNGTLTNVRWSPKEENQTQWALYQSGWQMSNKYWHASFTPTETAITVTNLSFSSMVGSTNAPTHFILQKVSFDGAGSTNNVCTVHLTANPWTALSGEASATSIKTWRNYNFDLSTYALQLPLDATTELRLLAQGGNRKRGVGATWYLYNLCLQGRPTEIEGQTIIKDSELAGAGFSLAGNAWDEDSGLISPNDAVTDHRPRFSLHSPANVPLYIDEPLTFVTAFSSGGATTESAGAFENSLQATLPYANRLLGDYAGEISAWDADDDRDDDGRQILGDIAFTAVDNDITPPGSVGAITVNGTAYNPDVPITRENAPWTNTPEFIVSFASVAVDQPAPEIGQTTSDGVTVQYSQQRETSGIGEYRVALDATPEAIAAAKPFPVAATNGAIANYGFEMWNDTAWVAANDNDGISKVQAYEGTNSMQVGASSSGSNRTRPVSQIIEFNNAAGNTVSVGGALQYRRNTVNSRPRFSIEAFTDSSLSTPVGNARNIDFEAGTEDIWTLGTIETNDIGDGTVNALRITLWSTGAASFFDDIRLCVNVGEGNNPTMRFVAGAESQGLSTKYLFAVDADNNRPDDRKAGTPSAFATAYDVTPPTPVVFGGHSTGASTESVDDPTTQFDLMWTTSEVGPDNPTSLQHPNYNAGAGTAPNTPENRDLLSPWRSYKVYCGTYNSMEAEDLGMDPVTFIQSTYIDTGAYTNWPSRQYGDSIADPSAVAQGITTYTGIDVTSASTMRIYDLDFDQDYIVVIVGLDKAGNEGPAVPMSWATNNTIKFSVTQGVMLARSAVMAAFPTNNMRETDRTSAGFYWIAAGQTNANGGYTRVTKEYDLIYHDAASFNEDTNWTWNLVGTIQSNWFTDATAQDNAFGNLRFYRASYTDRWRRTNPSSGLRQRPLASEEVYSMNNVILSEGFNYVALQGMPHTNTFASVFGTDTNIWPSSGSAGTGTTIEFYSPGRSNLVSDLYFFGYDGNWYDESGSTALTHVVQASNFFTRPFSINLPNPLPAPFNTTNAIYDQMSSTTNDAGGVIITNSYTRLSAMVWHPLMRVPTNGPSGSTVFRQDIATGSYGLGPDGKALAVYNPVAFNLPVAVHPGQLNLVESGFTPGPAGRGDSLYVINTHTKAVRGNSTIYCTTNSTGGQDWKFEKTGAGVGGGFIKPNDMIVIISRNGDGIPWTWEYNPRDFYAIPTRNMGE